MFIEATIETKTVNLKEIANAMQWSKEDSAYRRIQRFFLNFSFKETDLVSLIISILGVPWPYFLSMDRTNWKFGKVNINILTVGIVYQGIAFPIAWKLLNKRGNSDWKERIEVIEKCIVMIWKTQIIGILADREFVGGEWFAWLIEENIPFWIRIKENFHFEKGTSVKSLFKGVGKQPVFLRKSYCLKWNKVYLSTVNNKWELVIIASNIRNTKHNNAIENYKKRWAIEVLFFSIKSGWFHFEDTHMTNYKKISKLFSIIALVLTWCYKIWVEQEILHPKKLKKHGYKAISTFKLWLRYIANFFLDPRLRKVDERRVFKFLSCS